MVDKEAVNIMKWDVEREQSLVDRRAAGKTERTDTLRIEEATLCKERDRLGKEKLVCFCPLLLTFYSLAFPVH